MPKDDALLVFHFDTSTSNTPLAMTLKSQDKDSSIKFDLIGGADTPLTGQMRAVSINICMGKLSPFCLLYLGAMID